MRASRSTDSARFPSLVRLRGRLGRAASVVFFLSMLGDDCSGSLVSDGGFTRWRSDTELAAWQVKEGRIAKVSTWSEADPGVDLVGTPTTLSQALTVGATCAAVTIMGKVDKDADLRIAAGANTVHVPELTWTSYVDYIGIAQSVTDAGVFESVRPQDLTITKAGPGKAILVRIDVKSSDGCRPDTAAR